jgi:DNA-binding PadR family transcriptional regulator
MLMRRHCHEAPHFGDYSRHGHFGRKRGFLGGFSEGFGGRGMRAGKMLASGDLQLIILALLNDKPRHGYEIIKAIEEHCSGIYTPSPGVVYPALTYLEETGFTVSETEGTKKLYRIAAPGIEHLTKHRADADEMLEQLARFGKKMAQFQRQFVEEEVAGEEWGGSPRDQEKKEWRQLKAEFQELKHQFKAALFEKLHASMEEKQRVLEILRRTIQEIRGR